MAFPRCGNVIIDFSDAFEPFWDTLEWLNQVADGNLPAEVEIDEEGRNKRFIARHFVDSRDDYYDTEFRVIADYWKPSRQKHYWRTIFICQCNRRQLIGEFAKAMRRWVREAYDPEHWFKSEREEDPDNRYWNMHNLDADLDAVFKKIGTSYSTLTEPHSARNRAQ